MMLIALGANLDYNGKPPVESVRLAINVLDRLFTVRARSALYRFPAWPDPADPVFVNAVIATEITTHPRTALKALHSIEAGFGRRRTHTNGPRTLDLDLLAVDDMMIEPDEAGTLALPHPGLAMRDFVLVPLAEIAPDWVHPGSGKTVLEMRDALETITLITGD